uniref:Uncharacterized protein n=1 Tax=Bubo bubo TaxID=30461 RepID=A0A8C0ELP9_BUBBB
MKRCTFIVQMTKAAGRGGSGNGFGLPQTTTDTRVLFLHTRRHGDMLFLYPSSPAGSSSETMDTSVSQGLRPVGAPQVVEDEIDQYLIKQDGKIYRNRDQQTHSEHLLF